MSDTNRFYITTTLPYVNSDPHIGFALEIVAADVIARFQRIKGVEVVFNTGTDEHGLKIYQEAQKAQKSPQEYTDIYAARFKALGEILNLSFTHFIRTTDEHHIAAAQEFWKRCDANNDVYKKMYKVKYCVGCELEKTESELVEGKCPLHPNKELEIIEEENYFFRFSKYQQPLLDLYKANPNFVKPESKYKEIVSFVEKGLQDFSISRLKEKLPWGVPVPGDENQVMYVWFDALVNYISTLGWPSKESEFADFWPGIQIAGKDNLRQQSAMWQAMLLSAGISPSKQILINGFISVDGQKMSKSLGNVISPSDLLQRYGVDATRYILMSLGPVNDDMDVSLEKFDARYTSDLANGLGNTVQRVATLANRSGFAYPPDNPPGFRSQVRDQFTAFRFDLALFEIWETIRGLDKRIEEAQPWKMEGAPLRVFLMEAIAHLRQVGYELAPFMPETSAKILALFKGPLIEKPIPLFPRLEE
jgi:methionyl-tRNA synthetase